jgi:hypothetical protein
MTDSTFFISLLRIPGFVRGGKAAVEQNDTCVFNLTLIARSLGGHCAGTDMTGRDGE